MESKDIRKARLEQWIGQDCQLQPTLIQALPGDASFRRYFRVHTATRSLIAMDAPPPQEQCGPFVAIAKALRAKGLAAPEIVAADVENGFLLLTDFGDTTYLKSLNHQNADALYGYALQALAELTTCYPITGHTLPPFTAAFMGQEWAWHKEWFLTKWLGLSLSTAEEAALDQNYGVIVASAVSQPQQFMHRDYHSGNLMVLPASVGILDFQDAFMGPITYDVASLLRDCYIDWPEHKVTEWALSYKQRLALSVSDETFLQWFDWMSVQRHLKALLTFARKAVRDQQPQYLQHVPRTLTYLQQVTGRYTELAALHDYINKVKLLCVP